jgi:hypothetical protein
MRAQDFDMIRIGSGRADLKPLSAPHPGLAPMAAHPHRRRRHLPCRTSYVFGKLQVFNGINVFECEGQFFVELLGACGGMTMYFKKLAIPL